MHAVLAEPSDDPDFAPEQVSEAGQAPRHRRILASSTRRWRLQRPRQRDEPGCARDAGRRDELPGHAPSALSAMADGDTLRTRIHGDLHLGQFSCRARMSYHRFRGRAAKPLEERRARTQPAARRGGNAALLRLCRSSVERDSQASPRPRERDEPGEAHPGGIPRGCAETAFLAGYQKGRGAPLTARNARLLDCFDAREGRIRNVYEASNRPRLGRVPMRGLCANSPRRLHGGTQRCLRCDPALTAEPAAADALARGRLRRSVLRISGRTRRRSRHARAGISARRARRELMVERCVRRCGAAPSGTVTRGLFTGLCRTRRVRYLLRIQWPDTVQETEDPYSFGPSWAKSICIFCRRHALEARRALGAVPLKHRRVSGVSLRGLGAQCAACLRRRRFQQLGRRRHPMRLRHGAGIWEIFIPRLGPANATNMKSSAPMAESCRSRPIRWRARPSVRPRPPRSCRAPVVSVETMPIGWPTGDPSDAATRRSRSTSPCRRPGCDRERPTGIARLGRAWPNGSFLMSSELGFTHIELLPIMEHPFGGSWGYQPLSQFAPARASARLRISRVSSMPAIAPDSACILDWVPAHFPNDPHGLARFDGTALYEHADPREGFHPDWNTCIYNLGRKRSAGLSDRQRALLARDTFMSTGCASMPSPRCSIAIIRRRHGEWIPNRYGGRENLEAIDFLRRLKAVVGERCPGAMTIAEESTAWPGVSAPVATAASAFPSNGTWDGCTTRCDYIGARSDPSPLASSRYDFRAALRLFRTFHPAAFP